MSKFSDIIAAKNAANQEDSKPVNQKNGKPEIGISGKPESQKARKPETSADDKVEYVNLTVKVDKSRRQHWAAEAKRKGMTLTDVITKALTAKFGEPSK